MLKSLFTSKAATSKTSKLKMRWFGARKNILTGGVYDPGDAGRCFTVELLEKSVAGMVVKSRAIASRTAHYNDEIPAGHGFEFDIPTDWQDGQVHHPVFRVVETGHTFPRKPVIYQYAPPSQTGPDVEAELSALHEMLNFPGREDARPLLILVTHEASLTGAPVVALNVLRHLRGTRDWHFMVLSLTTHNAKLSGSFRESSDAFAAISFNNSPLRKRAVTMMMKSLPEMMAHRPVHALVSSLCSFRIGDVLGSCGIPSVWLIHEFSRIFTAGELETAFRGARHVVFPCALVKNSYLQAEQDIGAEGKVQQSRDQDSIAKISPPPQWQVLCRDALVRPQGIWRRDEVDSAFSRASADHDRLRTEFRTALGIPEQAFVVFSCGSVEARKGTDWFLALAQVMRSQAGTQDIHFLWVGTIMDDEYGRRIQEDRQRMRLDQPGSGVHFPGQMGQLEAAYAASDLFLMCSRNDPYPNVAIEALGRGLPLLGFDQGQGTSELIREHELGSLVPYQDINATATAICRYRDQPELRLAHGETGRQVSKTRFVIEDYAETIAGFLDGAKKP